MAVAGKEQDLVAADVAPARLFIDLCNCLLPGIACALAEAAGRLAAPCSVTVHDTS